MAGQKVEMDYTVVGTVSKGFETQSTVLDATGKLLKIAVEALRAVALFSLGTTAALANYLEVIMKKVNKLSEVCKWFADRLKQAVADHQKGDVEGKHYFEGDLGLG